MPLIALQDVSYAYDGGVVVRGLNFSVSQGDYLCVVGENGSGKSTLLRGLLRLKQPVEGTVQYSEALMGNDIGYLPQQTPVQRDFPASVFEVVLSGRMGARGLWPFYTKEDKQAAAAMLGLLGIAHLRSSCYRELSGGQQQRALLARALCATRKLLLLDEPVAGLDPLATQDLYQSIYRINRQEGVTIIMVSHDIGSAVQHATHMLHLKGSQLFFGTTADYLQSQVGRQYMEGLEHD